MREGEMRCACIVSEDLLTGGAQVDVPLSELEYDGSFDGEVLAEVLQDLLILVDTFGGVLFIICLSEKLERGQTRT